MHGVPGARIPKSGSLRERRERSRTLVESSVQEMGRENYIPYGNRMPSCARPTFGSSQAFALAAATRRGLTRVARIGSRKAVAFH